MTRPFSEDQPEPIEPPIRARVPDPIAVGAFSTGVIVMTAQTELILDFVQNLGRPHQIVARVILPHHVLPQFVDALRRNIDLYRKRWGELPQTGMPAPVQLPWASPDGSALASPLAADSVNTLDVGAGMPQAAQPAAPSGPGAGTVPPTQTSGASAGEDSPQTAAPTGAASTPPGPPEASGQAPGGELGGGRKASAQDIYDDLKIRDELLSGAYANAVMIGHGPHEFSLDFITNFYPHSCVSSRVFLAAGQVPRLLDSLQGTWRQLRQRLQPPPGGQPPAGEDPTGEPS